MADNLTYVQLVQRFQQSIVQNGKLTLRRAPAEGETSETDNYIDSDAINRVFDYVLGADNTLEIDLLAPSAPSYVPQVAAGVDDNGLSDALASGQASYDNPFYDEANQSIGVIGTGRSVLFNGMVVIAIFSVKAHGDGTPMPHLFLQASPQGSLSAQTDDWTLSTSFPELTPSIMFSYMEFVWEPPTNIPRLTICTYMVSEDVPAALYFTGEAKLASVFMDGEGNTPVGVSFLLGQDLNTRTQPIAGVITFPEHVATMSLRPPASQIQQALEAIIGEPEDESEPVNLGHLGSVPPAFVTLESRPMRGLPPNPEWVASTYATINTAFTVTLGGRPVVLPVSARVTTPLAPTLLRANLSALWVSLTASPDEIRALIDGVDISDPGTLDPTALGDFSLSQRVIPAALYMQLNPNAPDASTLINYISLALQNRAPWTIIDTGTALLQVDHAEIDITVYTPGVSATRYWALTVMASLAVGRHDGVIGFAFGTETGEDGDQYVTLSMVEGLITLQDVVGLLMGGGAVDLPLIALEDFTLYIDAKNKAYSGQFELISNWYVNIGGEEVAITALMMSASYDTDRGAKLTLAGVLDMTGLFDSYIAVRASYPGRNMGWNFVGVVETSTSIQTLLDNLGTAYSLDVPALPKVIGALTVEQVRVTFNTRTRNFSFRVQAAWRGDVDPSATLTLDIRRLAQGQDSAKLDLSGTLTFYTPDEENPGSYLPAAEFGLIFDTGGQVGGNAFAAYYQREQGATFSLYALLRQLFDPAHMDEEQRSALSFEVSEALLAYTDGVYVFGVGVGAALDLSALDGLPLIGGLFVGAPSLDLAAQMFYATDIVSQADLQRLNRLFKDRQRQLPADSTGGLAAGLSLTLKLWMDNGQPQTLPMPPSQKDVFPSVPAVDSPPTPTATTSAASHGVIWFNVQKAFGPLHISRFGLGYQRNSAELSGHIDADIVVSALTLSLMNLSLGFSFNSSGFESISYGLDGIGIQFKLGPIDLGGAFYHTERDGITEYDGYATLGIGPLQLSAIGSYTQDNGHPSLFVFAALDYPLGGLGFFFVNGLSAGFGFNRDLIMPSVSQVANYWLVQLADPSQAAPSSTPSDILNSAMAYVPPAVGEYWPALGLRFTTYEIIQTLAVAALSVGKRLEVDVIGLSTIMIPPTPGENITPLGEAQLALIGSFVIETDPFAVDLVIQGQLTPSSYIFSRSCKLTGGFAFGVWLGGDYDGDFVVTFGGYHPKYVPPKHYPVVPRIGFTWAVSSLLNAKGSLYFALTPSAIMAGMSLSFLFQYAGDSILPGVRASLDVGADFLLNWKPYHYAVNTSAEVNLDVIFHTFGTHEVSASAGADLELWGPNLGGHAALHMKVWFVKINVDLSFGATNTGATPLTWAEFQDSLMPPVQAKPDSVDAPSGSTHWNYITADVTSGLVRQIQGNDGQQDVTYNVVNPKDFRITTSSAIPITDVQRDSTAWDGVSYGALKRTGLGVTPMNTSYQRAPHSLILERLTTAWEPAYGDFTTPQPYAKNVPYAMWGTKLLDPSKPSSLNQPSLIDDTIGGVYLAPGVPVIPGSSQATDRDKFAYETTAESGALGWQSAGSFTPDPANTADPTDLLDNRRVIGAVQADMLAADTQATRQGVLDALGFISETFNLNQDLAQYAAFAPRCGAYTPDA